MPIARCAFLLAYGTLSGFARLPLVGVHTTRVSLVEAQMRDSVGIPRRDQKSRSCLGSSSKTERPDYF